MAFFDLVAQTDRAALSLLGGEIVTYEPNNGPPVPLTGIFDAKFVLAKGDANAGVESVGPAVFLRVEDLPENLEDDDPAITIRGVLYRVTERMPDDMGGVVLLLRSVS